MTFGDIRWELEGLAAAASFCLFFANICLANKSKTGWVLNFLGNTAWMIYGILMPSIVIGIEGVIFNILAVQGYLKWRKDERD
jgi:hypothetical protein